MRYVAYLKLGPNPVSNRDPEEFCMDDVEWIDFCDCNETQMEITNDPESLYLDIKCPINGMEFFGIHRDELLVFASSK